MPVPMIPFPIPGGGAPAAEGAEGAEGAAAGGAPDSASPPGASAAEGGEPLERDLGGEEEFFGREQGGSWGGGFERDDAWGRGDDGDDGSDGGESGGGFGDIMSVFGWDNDE